MAPRIELFILSLNNWAAFFRLPTRNLCLLLLFCSINTKGCCPLLFLRDKSLLIEELHKHFYSHRPPLYSSSTQTYQQHYGYHQLQDKPTSSGKVTFLYGPAVQGRSSSATNYTLPPAQHFTTDQDKALSIMGHLQIPGKQMLGRMPGLLCKTIPFWLLTRSIRAAVPRSSKEVGRCCLTADVSAVFPSPLSFTFLYLYVLGFLWYNPNIGYTSIFVSPNLELIASPLKCIIFLDYSQL